MNVKFYDFCILEKAIKNLNKEDCYKIKNLSIRNNCINNITIKNPELCKGGENYSSFCINNVALLTGNCQIIKEKLGEEFYDDVCWQKKAINENNISFCDYNPSKPTCIFQFYSVDEVLNYCNNKDNFYIKNLIQKNSSLDLKNSFIWDNVKDECIKIALRLEKFKYDQKLCNSLKELHSSNC